MWYPSGLDCYVDGESVEDPVDDLRDTLWAFRELLDEENERFGVETLRQQALASALGKFNGRFQK